MGIEKDGLIIKTKEGKNTYGIATGIDIDIPMLTRSPWALCRAVVT